MGNSFGILKYVKERFTGINKIFTRNKTDLGKMNNPATCRICYQSDGTLIEPCSCKGTVAFIHDKCLEKWIKVKNNSLCCELCTTNYKLNSNLYFNILIRKWFHNELFWMNLISFVFALLFYIFCIMILNRLKSFMCFEKSEVWTSTMRTINKDAASTTISVIYKFLITLVHILALSIIIISSTLFWLCVFIIWAIPFYVRATILDYL